MVASAFTLMPSYEMSLSPRQLEIIEAIANGATVKAVARSLGISAHTVKTHLRSVKDRLGAENATHAASIAVSQGIVTLGTPTGYRKDPLNADPLPAAV